MTYDVGNILRLNVEVKDENGVLVDPSSLELRLRESGSSNVTIYTLSSPEMVKSSTGIYYVDFEPTEDVPYYGKWNSENPNAAKEFTIDINNSQFD